METTTDQLREVFNKIDQDKNGYLNVDEVVLAAKELKQNVTKAEIEHVFC